MKFAPPDRKAIGYQGDDAFSASRCRSLDGGRAAGRLRLGPDAEQRPSPVVGRPILEPVRRRRNFGSDDERHHDGGHQQRR